MLEKRHRPIAPRQIRTALSDQVPSVVEAYVTVTVEGAKQAVNEMELDFALRKIQDGLSVEHLVDRYAFERAFIARRAAPAELKVDPDTDRVYLIGIGMPGREELELQDVPIKNKNGQLLVRDLVTQGVVHDDAVLSYTEVSWAELRTAEERVHNMSEDLKLGLCRYFQMSPNNLLGAVVATPSMTNEDYHWIAYYAHNPIA